MDNNGMWIDHWTITWTDTLHVHVYCPPHVIDHDYGYGQLLTHCANY